MKNVAIAAFAAAGLAMASVPGALAQDRYAQARYAQDRYQASKPVKAANANASTVAPSHSAADGGQMERKCVIMSCGTPWCYSVKR